MFRKHITYLKLKRLKRHNICIMESTTLPYRDRDKLQKAMNIVRLEAQMMFKLQSTLTEYL